MSSQPIDFSDLGGKPVAAPGGTIDFSDLGGKPVQSASTGQAPTATISAPAPSTGWRDNLSRWAENVSNDVKFGTDITGVGTVLKKMGAHGVYSGNSEAVGDFMASLPLGLLKATKGAGEVTQSGQTWQGTKDIVGGGLQAATIPSAFVAPEAAEAAAAVPGKIAARTIPSVMKQAAGELFESIGTDANKVPVSLDNTEQAALKLMDWQKKTQLGPTVNKFLNRITNPKLGSLTFEEAQDYKTLLGRLSFDESSKLAPAVQRDLQSMVIGLKQDLGNAAEQVGRGVDYYRANGDYASAARMSELYQTLKKAALPAAAGALGVTGYYRLANLLSAK